MTVHYMHRHVNRTYVHCDTREACAPAAGAGGASTWAWPPPPPLPPAAAAAIVVLQYATIAATTTRGTAPTTGFTDGRHLGNCRIGMGERHVRCACVHEHWGLALKQPLDTGHEIPPQCATTQPKQIAFTPTSTVSLISCV